jgi:ribosomal protein L35
MPSAKCQFAELRIYAQVKNAQGCREALQEDKDKKRKGKLRQAVLVSDADTPKIKRMIPY